MATINSLVADISLELGEEDTDPDVLALLQELVWESLEEFNSEFDWPWARVSETVASVDGTAEYTLGGAIAEIRFVQDTTNLDMIRLIEVDRLVRAGYDLTEEGTPKYYYISEYANDGDIVIGFWQVPDDSATTYTVFGIRNYSQIAVTDTLNIPKDALVAVKALSKYRALSNSEQKADERDDSLIEIARYRDLLVKLRKRHIDQYGVVRVFAWGDVVFHPGELNVPAQIPVP
jgi:hypothetical protein